MKLYRNTKKMGGIFAPQTDPKTIIPPGLCSNEYRTKGALFFHLVRKGDFVEKLLCVVSK